MERNDLNKINKALSVYKGKDARIEEYQVSLQRITIVIYELNCNDYIVLIATGCTWICGPTFWEKLDISIIKTGENVFDGCYAISDKNSGVMIRNSGVVLLKNDEIVAGVPDV